jgi:hypothetical protein
MTQPIRNILRDIGTFRESLLAVSDEVRLIINHSDSHADVA